MNKKYIKLFITVITVLLSFYTFLSTRYESSTVSSISVLLSLLFSLPIVMHSKYKNIKNNKTLCLITMLILYLITIIIITYLIIEIIKNQDNLFIIFDTIKIQFSTLIFMTTSWLILFYSFIDISKKEIDNFMINLIVLSIVILIHINYYINPNLKTLINENSIGEKAMYITQNYIYFAIMYILIMINKIIKNNTKT